jgi:DNA polymerase I
MLPKATDWYNVEMEYQRIAFGWEDRGLRVDPLRIQAEQAAYGGRLTDLTHQLADLGIDNPRSSQAVAHALGELGWDAEDFTPSGQVALDKVVLARLTEAGGVVGRGAKLLMEYRRTDKWKAVYFDKMFEAMTGDQRVHPFVRTMGAHTGRSSITDPPLQTIPKDAGPPRVFIADRGYELWPVDYDAQELRIFAALAGEQDMIREFTEGDGKLHDLVARLADVDRNVAKTLSYARLYGAGLSKLALATGKTEHEMLGIIARIDARFPEAARFMDRVVEQARERESIVGWAYAEIPRSRRRIGVETDAAYKALNYTIQGFAADSLKLAALRLDRAGYGDAMLLPVHDELLFQFPAGEGVHLAHEVAALMEDTFLSVPLSASPSGPFASWGEGYK